MSAEEYEVRMAELRREKEELAKRFAEKVKECDRLMRTIQALFPIPTEAELAHAEANPGQLTRFLDSLAAELGVVEDGR